MGKLEKKVNHCLNCNFTLEDNFTFCPECGQSSASHEKLSSLFSHFLADYFTFDSKIVRSILPLIVKPGFLTQEYIAGKRISYIQPLRLFLFLSIIFFLVLGFADSSLTVSKDGETLGEDFWDNFFEVWLPKLFFLLMPVFALLLKLLLPKNKGKLLHHFLFSLHFHSTLFLLGIIYSLISLVFSKLNLPNVNGIILIVYGLYNGFYLWRALKNVYELNFKKTTFVFIMLSVLYFISLTISSFLLLFISIKS